LNKGRAATACTLLALAQGAAAQEDAPCPQLAFAPGAPTQASLAVDQVEGQVVGSPPDAPKLIGAVGGACLALFTADGKQVAVGSANERGQFRLAHQGQGKYVLIEFGPLPAAIALPLSVTDGAPSGAPQRGVLTGPELERRMADIDSRNDVRLREIVRQFGWPARDLVGVDGGEAALTLVMHMPPATQQAMLPLVEAAYRVGTVPGTSYANLVDHVLVDEGKPQVFGTVAEPFKADGEVVFKPIEDEAHVDERRAEIGLMPLAEYREMLRRLYFPTR
jgi:hypothetical protein